MTGLYTYVQNGFVSSLEYYWNMVSYFERRAFITSVDKQASPPPPQMVCGGWRKWAVMQLVQFYWDRERERERSPGGLLFSGSFVLRDSPVVVFTHSIQNSNSGKLLVPTHQVWHCLETKINFAYNKLNGYIIIIIIKCFKQKFLFFKRETNVIYTSCVSAF
jgi:hypothetical protein